MMKKLLSAFVSVFLFSDATRTFSLSTKGLERSNDSDWRWHTSDSKLWLNDQEIKIRGISWFGFETQDFVINGLWSHPMDWYLDKLVSLNINSIRIPFSSEWIYYNPDLYPYDGLINADPEAQHKKSIEIMDELFEKTKSRGISILLDLHRLHKEYISELWYSPTDRQYTSETFFATWFFILDRYRDYPNLLGIDILNEPHGQATFGSNNPSNDWRLFIQDALPLFVARYPDKHWFFFVEGIEWGHTFRDYRNHGFDLPMDIETRIVFSPHVYGKSVVPSTPIDINILHNIWYNDYGFLVELGKTIVPGEWGGQTYLDKDWMNIFADYLISIGANSNYLWSLGPNSGDVAGLLLDNWTDIDWFKADLMKRLQPEPTRFHF